MLSISHIMMKSLINHTLPMLFVAALAGLFLGILAPLGTQFMSVIGRIAFWVSICVIGAIGAACADGILIYFKKKPQPFILAGLQAAGSSLFVFGFLISQITHTGINSFLLSLFYVCLISLMICSIGVILRKQIVFQTTQMKGEHELPRLLEKLPMRLQNSEIFALNSEDHYVHIHTSKGTEMTLMRLFDAVRDSQPLDGLKVHRSWWVAKQGIEDVQKKNRTAVIRLKNNVSVPVSRSGYKMLKDAGWL